ncbi:MAG: phosphoserine phosphatase SerB [Burkholderiaceae bacterium]
MSRLIIQHPQLADTAIQAFSQSCGAAPDQRSGSLAIWSRAAIDGQHVSALAETHQVDAEIVAPGLRLADFRLAVFDMDSTLITIECVDEIADFAGRKAEVAAITEAAMRGEIADYDDSLRRRVGLLAGLGEDSLERVWHERVRLSPGAQTLVEALQGAGLVTLLVSGGFTFFTERLRRRLRLDWARSNLLEIDQGRLTGRLIGPIVNAALKRRIVEQVCRLMQISPQQAIVVGDGANDLQMMSIAGLSVAYHAKPVVRDETTHAINHCGLDALLNLFEDQAA